MAKVQLIGTEIEDLNEAGKQATLGNIMVIVKAQLDGAPVDIGFETSETTDIGAVSDSLEINEITGEHGTIDFDYDDLDGIDEVKSEAQKVFDEYVSKHYDTEAFDGMDANSLKNDVSRKNAADYDGENDFDKDMFVMAIHDWAADHDGNFDGDEVHGGEYDGLKIGKPEINEDGVWECEAHDEKTSYNIHSIGGDIVIEY